MPTQQQHRPGSSRLCQLQLMNSVRFTAGANGTVPKSLVHARAVTPTNPYDERHSVAQILRRAVPPFQKSAGIWIGHFPPRGKPWLGGWRPRARHPAREC